MCLVKVLSAVQDLYKYIIILNNKIWINSTMMMLTVRPPSLHQIYFLLLQQRCVNILEYLLAMLQFTVLCSDFIPKKVIWSGAPPMRSEALLKRYQWGSTVVVMGYECGLKVVVMQRQRDPISRMDIARFTIYFGFQVYIIIESFSISSVIHIIVSAYENNVEFVIFTTNSRTHFFKLFVFHISANMIIKNMF